MSTVLLIEPDMALAAVYRKALVEGGHTVLTAHHAQDAVAVADTTKPDVVVLELQLVGHNGFEFLYEFRSYADWQHVPVILVNMVTPHALQITQEQMQQLGIVYCLYKPATTLRKLNAAVRDALVPA